MKVPKFNRDNALRFSRMYPDVLSVHDDGLFCKLCECIVASDLLMKLNQHFDTIKHTASRVRAEFGNCSASATASENDEDSTSQVKVEDTNVSVSLNTLNGVKRFVPRLIELYPSVLCMDEDQLFCKLCECPVSSSRLFNVQQHFNTAKHRQAVSSCAASKADEDGDKRLRLPFSKKNFKLRCVQLYPKVLCIRYDELYCMLCDCPVSSKRSYNVRQHFSSAKHQAGVANGPASSIASFENNNNEDVSDALLEVPKEASKVVVKCLRRYPNVFRIEDGGLYCNSCECPVSSTRMFNVIQHLNTSKHTEAVRSADETKNGCLKGIAQRRLKLPKLGEHFVYRCTLMYPKLFGSLEGRLYCKLCDCCISLGSRLYVWKHLDTNKHKNAAAKIAYIDAQSADDEENQSLSAPLKIAKEELPEEEHLNVGSKVPKVDKNFVSRFIKQHPNIVTAFGDDELYCQLCKRSFSSSRNYYIRQHFGTAKHKAAARALGGDELYCKLNKCPFCPPRSSDIRKYFDATKSKVVPKAIKQDEEEDAFVPLKKPKLEEGSYETQCDKTYFDVSCATDDCLYCKSNSREDAESREDFSCGTTSDEDEFDYKNDPLDMEGAVVAQDFESQTFESLMEEAIPLKTLTRPSAAISNSKTSCHLIPILCSEDLKSLRETLGDKRIWVAIDESQKNPNHIVATFSFGILEETEDGKSFLLNRDTLSNVNASSIIAFFIHSLQKLWPQRIKFDKLLVVITEPSPHMAKAMECFQMMMPKLLHVTCFARGLQSVANVIKDKYPLVDRLITEVNAVFSHAPSRQLQFEQQQPNTPLPPDAIPSKKGSWLEAALYHCDNFEAVHSVIESFGESAEKQIESCRLLYKNRELKTHLAYIKSKFTTLAGAIKTLASQNLQLNAAISLLDHVERSLQGAHEVHEAFKQVLQNNSGYEVLRKIDGILERNSLSFNDEYIEKLSPLDLASFKLCRTALHDVDEQSSSFNSISPEKLLGFVIKQETKC